ncbi:hypothetical protein RFI_07630 [Reticulomyxa filosa]|uniref:Uncharacterized protein n=1 Tax=Reticulomyxa filosa TaxID=46433 RepID=X6NU19_RETFI|nr:hypothetical protein RFI_07630 [Reticulomyxa filosa]|eukprot:ETO29491.1 hypothetical protein RFI_07630 [Reticulomyxa filosa]
MLNTMRLQCRVSKRLMPNYGRLKKVTKSMDRLMQIWNERAYITHEALKREKETLKEEARVECIEHRRLMSLKKREKIKQLFFDLVEQHEHDLSPSQYNEFATRRNTIQEFLFLQNHRLPDVLDPVKRRATDTIQDANVAQVFDKDLETKAKDLIHANFGHLAT